MTSKRCAGKAISFFAVYVPGTIIFKLSFETSAESYVLFKEFDNSVQCFLMVKKTLITVVSKQELKFTCVSMVFQKNLAHLSKPENSLDSLFFF
jgi:hypothetical protein